MSGRHGDVIQHLHDAVRSGPGELDEETRSGLATGRAVPDEARTYVEKVARHAYRVTDADVEALRSAGYSDAAIFELTVCVALGAGLLRRDAGLAALAAA